MTESWISELVEGFWESAGGGTPYPRDLMPVVSLALPVAVTMLPALALDRIEDWLARQGCEQSFRCANRRLQGGLIARAGIGLIFVDSVSAVDERRFTLAHEVAHFLVDYMGPRQRALAVLGDGIAGVLDGRRLPTRKEQVDAVLGSCPLGVYTDLLERDGDRGAHAASLEDRADRVAWELLAPAETVLRLVSDISSPDLSTLLREQFGLPIVESDRYARRLRRECGPPPSFVDWLNP